MWFARSRVRAERDLPPSDAREDTEPPPERGREKDMLTRAALAKRLKNEHPQNFSGVVSVRTACLSCWPVAVRPCLPLLFPSPHTRNPFLLAVQRGAPRTPAMACVREGYLNKEVCPAPSPHRMLHPLCCCSCYALLLWYGATATVPRLLPSP